MWKGGSLLRAQTNSETKLLGDIQRKRLTELTFLYHSLQNIHVVLLRHAAERGELGLGDKLQELEQSKRTLWKTWHKFSSRRTRRRSVLLPHYFMSVMLRSLQGTCAPEDGCCLEPIQPAINLTQKWNQRPQRHSCLSGSFCQKTSPPVSRHKEPRGRSLARPCVLSWTACRSEGSALLSSFQAGMCGM